MTADGDERIELATRLHDAAHERCFIANSCRVPIRHADGDTARRALEDAGIHVLAARDVVVQRLHQGEPGQLGKLTRRMAEAGVNIEVLYSDHDHQLILVVDDVAKVQAVAAAWSRDI